MGLDTITVLPPDPDLSAIQDLVAEYPAEVSAAAPRRSRHPARTEEFGVTWEYSGAVGKPKDLGISTWVRLVAPRGTHPKSPALPVHLAPSLSATAYMLQQAEVDSDIEMRVYHIQSRQEFHELDELGTAPPSRVFEGARVAGIVHSGEEN